MDKPDHDEAVEVVNYVIAYINAATLDLFQVIYRLLDRIYLGARTALLGHLNWKPLLQYPLYLSLSKYSIRTFKTT